MHYIFKLLANIRDDDFLCFMPFSFIKSQQITTSARKKWRIRLVRLENELYPLCNVRSTGQSSTYKCFCPERRVLHGNTWFRGNKSPYFARAKFVVVAVEQWNTNHIGKMLQWINRVGYRHTYIHNWPIQPFCQNYGLASHTTHVVHFIREW